MQIRNWPLIFRSNLLWQIRNGPLCYDVQHIFFCLRCPFYQSFHFSCWISLHSSLPDPIKQVCMCVGPRMDPAQVWIVGSYESKTLWLSCPDAWTLKSDPKMTHPVRVSWRWHASWRRHVVWTSGRGSAASSAAEPPCPSWILLLQKWYGWQPAWPSLQPPVRLCACLDW
jgi:hypothetical protein